MNNSVPEHSTLLLEASFAVNDSSAFLLCDNNVATYIKGSLIERKQLLPKC